MELLNFIKENENWKSIITKAPYNITIKENNDYILLKYNQTAKDTDWNSKIVQQCRGTILDKKNFKPVCVPFFRFFNLGEPYAANVDFNNCRILEKIDGSIIKVWHTEDENGDGEWHISTNGTINAFDVELSTIAGEKFKRTFGDLANELLMKKNFFLKSYVNNLSRLLNEEILLEKGTHMFELVSRYNRVVIDYEEPQLFYLGSRSNIDFHEYNSETLSHLFDKPREYELKYKTNDNLKELAELFSGKKEGLVVVDNNYNRVKVKNAQYVLMSKTRYNITDTDLLKIISKNEIEEFIATVDDKHIVEKILFLEEAIDYLDLFIKCNQTVIISMICQKNKIALNNCANCANDRNFKKEYYECLKENIPNYLIKLMLNFNYNRKELYKCFSGDRTKTFMKKTLAPFIDDYKEKIIIANNIRKDLQS